MRDHIGLFLDRQLARVLGVIATDDEAERDLLPPFAIDVQPAGSVGARHHLATPQKMQFVHRARRRQPIDDAAARPAAIEREHEPRRVRLAARRERPQAEAAVQAVHRCAARLDEREQRIPKQRPVREHPPAGPTRFRIERTGE